MSGRGIVGGGVFRSELIEANARTSDPTNPRVGDWWIRSDVQPSVTGATTVAALRIQGTGGVLEVPFFDAAEESNLGADVYVGERFRFDDGTVGFIAETDQGGAKGSPRVVTPTGAEYQAHDALELSAIPDTVVDNFEAEDANPAGPYSTGEDISTFYRGYTSGFSRTSASPIDGSHSLETSAGNGYAIFSEPGDGLPRYPQDNDTLNVLVYGSGALPVIFFDVTYDEGNDNINGYGCRYWANDRIDLKRHDNSSASNTNSNRTSLNSTPINTSTDTAYWMEISTPDASGNISCTLYEIDGSLNKGGQVATVSATDTTHDNRGIGFGTSLDGTGLIGDRLRIS